MTLEGLYSLLSRVMPGRVWYGTNVYDGENPADPPYVVYQETGNRASLHFDDRPAFRYSDAQVTLVTERKDPVRERALEEALSRAGLEYSLLSETTDPDRSVSRVYETRLEEIEDAEQHSHLRP